MGLSYVQVRKFEFGSVRNRTLKLIEKKRNYIIRAVLSEDNTDNGVRNKLERGKAQGKEICQQLSQKSRLTGQSQAPGAEAVRVYQKNELN